MKQVIVITGASSGFGALAARELAKAGHTVYASMRETTTRNAPRVEEVKTFAQDNKADLRTVELDVASQDSVDYLIFDRAANFNEEVISTVKSFGITPKRTNFRSPWQNGVDERWLGNCS